VDEVGATDVDYRLFVDSTTTFRALLCDTVISNAVTVEVLNLQAPTTVGDTDIVTCGDPGTAILVASSTRTGVDFNWYDSPTSTNIITTNDTLLYTVNTSSGTPSQNSATFYVAEATGSGVQSVGAPDIHIGTYA